MMIDEQVRAKLEVDNLNSGLLRGVSQIVKGWIAVAILVPVAGLVAVYCGFTLLGTERPEAMDNKPLWIAVPMFAVQVFFIFRWWRK